MKIQTKILVIVFSLVLVTGVVATMLVGLLQEILLSNRFTII